MKLKSNIRVNIKQEKASSPTRKFAESEHDHLSLLKNDLHSGIGKGGGIALR